MFGKIAYGATAALTVAVVVAELLQGAPLALRIEHETALHRPRVHVQRDAGALLVDDAVLKAPNIQIERRVVAVV